MTFQPDSQHKSLSSDPLTVFVLSFRTTLTTRRYETNEMGFSLVGPNYYHRFREIALKMVTDFKVNLFKFDGVAGHHAT